MDFENQSGRQIGEGGGGGGGVVLNVQEMDNGIRLKRGVLTKRVPGPRRCPRDNLQ